MRFRAPILSACCAGALAVAISAHGQTADPSGTMFEVSVPGGVRSALAALDDPIAADRSQFLVEFIRRFYNIPIITKTDARHATIHALAASLDNAAPSTDTVPLPLSPDLWLDVVFAGRVTEHNLVTAIVQSRDASLLYYGLLSLDEPTRAWIGAHRPVLAELAQHAASFAAAAPGLRLSGDAILVPGGESARPLWEALVGQPTRNPEAFVRALLVGGNGRLAYFFGTISQLTPAQIELSLAPASLNAVDRVDAARRLYGVFERLSPGWRIGERIFQRPPLDPTLLVADLRLDRDSRPILPGTRRFWSLVFLDSSSRGKANRDDDLASVADGPPVDVAWLCEQIFSADTGEQQRRYHSVLFMSRTLDRVTPGNARNAVDAARAMMRYPALISTLERAHVKNVAVLASAGRRAEQLSTIVEEGRMVRSLAEFQAALALLTRAGLRGSLSADRLTTWVASLCALEPDDRGDYDGRVVKWLDERIRESSVNGAATSNGLTDENVLNLIAGPVVPKPRIVEWEGTRYRVDFNKAETTRLEQLLGDAPPPYLSSAQSLVGVADTLAADGLTAERLRAEASVFDRAAHAVSLDVAETWNETGAHARYRDADGKLARAAQGGDLRAAARVAPELRLLADDLAARGLMALTYASAMGQRERTAISADDAARRHDFGWSLMGRHRGPWLFPVAGAGPGGWRVVGSVLGLDVSLAEFSLLALSSKLPPQRPTLGDDDRRVMIDAVALITPAELTDSDSEAIVAALQNGRARVAATRTPVEGASLAAEARLSPIRRTLLAWTLRHDPSRAATFFSLTELLWLGRDAVPIERNLDAWGAPVQARTGCLCLQMLDPRSVDDFMGRWGTGVKMTGFPDLNLRLAELLAELHMPAPLLAPVLASASLDFVNSVVTRDQDDQRGMMEFVRTLRVDRVELYLALLTTGGPLVPVEGPDTVDKEARHQ